MATFRPHGPSRQFELKSQAWSNIIEHNTLNSTPGNVRMIREYDASDVASWAEIKGRIPCDCIIHSNKGGRPRKNSKQDQNTQPRKVK